MIALPATPRLLLPIATALALLIGFADLVRGGISVSAIFLAIGYCVLVPMWLWRGPVNGARETQESEDERPSYGAAACTAAAVFALYLITLAPTTAMWDTSEYIAAAYTFGLPHPPGNPFFVIIGRAFSILPVAGSVATRINVLAALCSAVAAGMWFLVTERVLTGWLTHRWQRIAGGAAAALIGATAFTVWTQSVVNEKVYTVSLVGIAIVSWLAIRWSDDPRGPKADRLLIVIAYLCGLGYANHMAGMIAAPAIGIAVLLRDPRALLRGRLVFACVAAVLLGLTPFATQPIRAAYHPPINEGAPTACRESIGWSCTFSKGTLDAFMYNFNRTQYSKPALSDRQAPFVAQVVMWWWYFKWQWLRDPGGHQSVLQAMLAAVFLVLGGMGGYAHWRRDPRSFAFFGPLMLTMTFGLIYYLNFKYGFSQAPLLKDTVAREVRDRDYFYLWSFSAWSVWAALGLVYVWESIASMIGVEKVARGREATEVPRARSWMLASPVFLLAAVPLIGNWTSASRHGDTVTRDFARDLLNSVEPYGVLIVVGDNDTFPLWYAQEVEGVRKDVVVANTSLLGTQWYAHQMIQRPVYEYDAAKGPALYRGTQWAKPSGSPLAMTLEAADSVPDYYQTQQPIQFEARGIKTTIDPRALESGVFKRADAFVLRMMQDSWPSRPFYFAGSAHAYAAELGLAQYVLTQGLASKVFVPDTSRAATRDTLFVEGDGWFDLPRTHALWRDVYVGHTAAIANRRWVDRPSVNIPYMYMIIGAELADVLDRKQMSAAGDTVFATARAVGRATSVPGVVEGLDALRAQTKRGGK